MWLSFLPIRMCVRDFRCVCPEGFEGDSCEINIDDCEDNDCENNSTCVDGINNYTCMCSPEYTGNPNLRGTTEFSCALLHFVIPFHLLKAKNACMDKNWFIEKNSLKLHSHRPRQRTFKQPLPMRSRWQHTHAGFGLLRLKLLYSCGTTEVSTTVLELYSL